MFSVQLKTKRDLLWTHQGRKADDLKCREQGYMPTTQKQLDASHSVIRCPKIWAVIATGEIMNTPGDASSFWTSRRSREKGEVVSTWA